MKKTKNETKHLWKHNANRVWYYQRTFRKKRYKFSLNTKDINEARNLRNKYDLELAVNGSIQVQNDEPPYVPVFGKVCLDWFEIKKQDCRHDTIINGYKPKLNAHILKTPFVDRPINTIETEDIESWWRKLTCSYDTTNGILDVLSIIYRFVMKKSGLIQIL